MRYDRSLFLCQKLRTFLGELTDANTLLCSYGNLNGAVKRCKLKTDLSVLLIIKSGCVWLTGKAKAK